MLAQDFKSHKNDNLIVVLVFAICMVLVFILGKSCGNAMSDEKPASYYENQILSLNDSIKKLKDGTYREVATEMTPEEIMKTQTYAPSVFAL